MEGTLLVTLDAIRTYALRNTLSAINTIAEVSARAETRTALEVLDCCWNPP